MQETKIKTTSQFNEAVREFKNKGFVIDEYESKKRSLESYKAQLIEELNIYNIDLRHDYIKGYDFEEVYKNVVDFFKDSKNKRIKQLNNSFIHIPQEEFYNSDIYGYTEKLKISFNELDEKITEYFNKLKSITIKRSLYCDKWNRERTINEIKADFKQFVELCLNLPYSESDFKFNEYNEHLKFTLLSDKLKDKYKDEVRKRILSLFTKPIYFRINDLEKVLNLSGLYRFILCKDNTNNNEVVYLYCNSYQYDKVKQHEINKPSDLEILKDLRKGDSFYLPFLMENEKISSDTKQILKKVCSV